MTTKTKDEIEKLKNSWKHDPIWDIEDTEGFEEYYDELLAWRQEYEAERKKIADEQDNMRIEKVMLATGLGRADRDTLLSLYTFEEISRQAEHYDRLTESMEVSITATLIQATLLQAAQLKRIADALERMQDGDTLVNLSRKLGGEQ